MSKPVIKDATLSDAERCADIYGWSVENETGSFEYEAPGVREMARRMQTLQEQDYPYLILEIGGEVLGFAYASAFRPRRAYQHTVECSIYLDRRIKGHGYGKKLLKALIDRCTSQGFQQMIAVIGGVHNEASVGVHRALGFEHTGVLKQIGHKNDQWLDVILMQRTLRKQPQ